MNKINDNWVFGQRAGLSFSSGSPVPNADSVMTTNEGCASVSDASGNLLFYTDGQNVWKGDHSPVAVSGLMGHPSSSQSAIIVPDPGNAMQYYIFTAAGSSGGSAHVACVLLNVSTWASTDLSSGLPATTGFSPTEKITAVQHVNCRDFFVITLIQKTDVFSAETGDGLFRVFLVNATGVSHVGDTTITGPNNKVHDQGYLRASRNGQQLAVANWELSNVLLCAFDNTTGVVNAASPPVITVPSPLPMSLADPSDNTGHSRCVYGVEFSPDSNLLYYSVMGESVSISGALGRGYVYQVDLATLAGTLLGTHDMPAGAQYPLGALQLAVDDVIYVAQCNQDKIGTIADPNVAGAGANLSFSSVTLSAGTQCRLGLPNLLPNPCDTDDCDCGCGCAGCNENAEEQNEELIERAKGKFNTLLSGLGCGEPFQETCTTTAVNAGVSLTPCFYMHWGDGHNDQIEEHDTEVFYITVCNPFTDVQFNGLRITSVTIIPDIHPIDKIQVVPDRFISFDCLPSCTCQTREFAMITRANDTAGNYKLEVAYCFDSITLTAGGNNAGTASFDFEITED